MILEAKEKEVNFELKKYDWNKLAKRDRDIEVELSLRALLASNWLTIIDLSKSQIWAWRLEATGEVLL
jgi:hypothetical protein